MRCTAQGSPAVWRMPPLRLKEKERRRLGLRELVSERRAKRKGTGSAVSADVWCFIFGWLQQDMLGVCCTVCLGWREMIDMDATLNISVRTQYLTEEAYDEVYNFAGLDLYGRDVDFCFTDPPPAAMLTETGWKQSRPFPSATPLRRPRCVVPRKHVKKTEKTKK
eukprot:TRINITY_DN37499_c0_g1_i1.p1 TRINITY_DN37499_c0_g1~~TRINITY_DN37499_c0_g1_i1.p1  ORF type:complete len:165 (+),score=28.52 TRINITY_DN37499_c0_g1_i1:58-552(+)